MSIFCKCTLSHCSCVPSCTYLPPIPQHTPTHTPLTHTPLTHTLDVSESFLHGGCVQLPQLSSWPGQGLCHDSQQVSTGSTIGPVPWIQWREITLHILTGTTEQCYSIELQCRLVMCKLPYVVCAFCMNIIISHNTISASYTIENGYCNSISLLSAGKCFSCVWADCVWVDMQCN